MGNKTKPPTPAEILKVTGVIIEASTDGGIVIRMTVDGGARLATILVRQGLGDAPNGFGTLFVDELIRTGKEARRITRRQTSSATLGG